MRYTIKRFSIAGDTLDWARKFTPPIRIDDRTNLRILGPWTVVGAVVGFIKGLAKKIKHFIKGTPVKDKHPEAHIENPKEKQFSEISLNSNYSDYIKIIPGYTELAILSSANSHLLRKLSKENRKYIYENFPSFLVLSMPKEINEYRKDFIDKYNQDYAEILFTYGGEVDFLWDFDEEQWYTRDHTYNPSKEYLVRDNDVLTSIRSVFDPSEDPLLEARLKKWEGNEKLSGQFNMRKYCEIIRKMIDDVKGSKNTKIFSQTGDLLWNLSNLRECKGYPKFVIDYIKTVQPYLKGGDDLCYFCFPVAPMDGGGEDGDYFWNSADDGMSLGLIYKDGGWYEKKGLFFKKLEPVPNPARWMVDKIEKEVGDGEGASDFPKYTKALSALKKLI